MALLDDWPDEAMEALSPTALRVATLTQHEAGRPALDVALGREAFYTPPSAPAHHAGRIEGSRRWATTTPASPHHGPAGLDIGAVSPAEIAVSVMAEMTRACGSRRGMKLPKEEEEGKRGAAPPRTPRYFKAERIGT